MKSACLVYTSAIKVVDRMSSLPREYYKNFWKTIRNRRGVTRNERHGSASVLSSFP
jgi:hypothetical protein